MKNLVIPLLFLTMPWVAKSTSIDPGRITERISDANKIVVCVLSSKSGIDSATFQIIKQVKGKRTYERKVTLLINTQYLDSNQYYVLGEFERGGFEFIAETPLNEASLKMLQKLVEDVRSVDHGSITERRRGRYMDILFGLIDTDFLKHKALYELSNPGRFLYAYAKKFNLYNSYGAPDQYKAVSDAERKKMWTIFDKLGYPSHYEWPMSRFFIGHYDNELKSLIYKFIKRDMAELEKNKYFNTQTGSMLSVLREIEDDERILSVIDNFFQDNNVYVDHTIVNYLKAIDSIKH